MLTRPKQLRLPLTFDPVRLDRDLSAVIGTPRIPQPSKYHDGEWTGIALHSPGGRQTADPSRPALDGYRPTELLARAPYFEEILDTLDCPKQMVRLLALGPGAIIREHFDFYVGFQAGLLRLHIPIVTHPDVVMLIAGERCEWMPGELWYGDFNQTHSVDNKSPITRFHMVVDVEINDFVLSLFPPELIQEERETGIATVRSTQQLERHALAKYECEFEVPTAVLPIFRFSHDISAFVRPAAGKTRASDGGLLVLLDDEPSVRLFNLSDDEFRICGWSSAFTVRFVFDGETPRQLQVSVKGAPTHLRRARAGVRSGDNVKEQLLAMAVV